MSSSGTLTIRLVGDSAPLKKELDGVQSKLSGFKSKVGGFGAGIAAGFGAAFATDKLLAFGGEMLGLGNQLQTWRTKAKTVFGGSSRDVEAWADKSAAAMGLTDDELTGLAASFGDLLVPMGFAREQAADMSKKTLELSGALSAWSGGQRSAAEVAEILQAAMLGERDSLKSLGISISEADVQARLAQKGQEGLTGAALQQAEALATQELILEKSTDAQKAWADGTFEAQQKQNELKAKMGELKEQIASALVPAFQGLTDFTLRSVIPTFEKLAGWVRQHWPEIREHIVNAVRAVRDAVLPILDLIKSGWKRWGDEILDFVKERFEAIRTQIEGALNIIRGVIQTVTSLIKGDWSGVWDGIKQTVGGAFQIIRGKIEEGMAVVKLVVRVGLDLIESWFGDLPGKVGRALGGLAGFITAPFRAAFNAVAEFWNRTVGSLSFKAPSWMPGIGGKGFDVPDIPRFDSGGIMPGPRGRPGLALLHGGETILPTHKRPAGGVTNHFHFPNYVGNRDELIREVRRGLIDVARSNGNALGGLA